MTRGNILHLDDNEKTTLIENTTRGGMWAIPTLEKMSCQSESRYIGGMWLFYLGRRRKRCGCQSVAPWDFMQAAACSGIYHAGVQGDGTCTRSDIVPIISYLLPAACEWAAGSKWGITLEPERRCQCDRRTDANTPETSVKSRVTEISTP